MTARERFESIKANPYSMVNGGPSAKDFMVSLVEAAVAVGVQFSEYSDFKTEFWESINQRMAEGEAKS